MKIRGDLTASFLQRSGIFLPKGGISHLKKCVATTVLASFAIIGHLSHLLFTASPLKHLILDRAMTKKSKVFTLLGEAKASLGSSKID